MNNINSLIDELKRLFGPSLVKENPRFYRDNEIEPMAKHVVDVDTSNFDIDTLLEKEDAFYVQVTKDPLLTACMQETFVRFL